jgi:hypothetical protein
MIKFGPLACGRIAKGHCDLLGGNHIDGATLTAVCDSIRMRADIAPKFGVPAGYDIDDFSARKDTDAVAVLTPSGMHLEHVIACARAGKHVVVESRCAAAPRRRRAHGGRLANENLRETLWRRWFTSQGQVRRFGSDRKCDEHRDAWL